ncbi:LysR family transcriptional regulator [Terasakiella sp. A23]|uniref:LysR family transcriptional regulator n=1 Tax=Terasakiella sp. FCG-A23 TaxID=3080561 RepID=UPI0029535424|nr:LysR family transcriptional regulator [Terasakiella sp. A23]MDV7340698.1 LysR family transcriptional regulator [Terasakiella sp. A23]
MNIRNLDLNLLVQLEALLNEASVTKAAASINLSQPAMSRALDRLRHMLKDPLLVRSGRGMVLTPRAEALRSPLQNALERVRTVLAPNEFNPATSQAHFRIIGVDYFSHVMMPAVLERLYREAPNIQVSIENMSAGGIEALKAGEIDLGIGVIGDGPKLETSYHQKLFDDDFICVMRKGHVLANAPLDLNGYCAADHALLSVTGKGGGAIDGLLENIGRTRKISLRLPHFLAIPSVVSRTDLITTIPRKLAMLFQGQGVAMCELPGELENPGFTISQIWHERFHHDPARKWLRSIVKELSRRI